MNKRYIPNTVSIDEEHHHQRPLLDPGLYVETMNIAQQMRDTYEKLFGEYDLIFMPTTPFVAPANVDWKRRDPPVGALKPSMRTMTNTAIFDVTGHPAMSLPVGFAPAKEDANIVLPVGMQLIGGLWQEQKILDAGFAWKSANDWKKIDGDDAHNVLVPPSYS